MRYRVTDYRIIAIGPQVVVRLLTIPNDVVLEKIEGSNELTTESARRVVEAIRLIVDETIGEVFCSSMQKSKVVKVHGSVYYQGITSACDIEFAAPEGKTANSSDQFTIEMDWGEEVAKESTLTSAKEEIIEAVNSAQVDIDTSNLASKNLEEFFEVVSDDSEEIITDEEITQELEDIFNTIFN